MFDFLLSEAARLARAIVVNKNNITDEQFILKEIEQFKLSDKRNTMIIGEKYYLGKHDILSRQRTVIGADGELTVVDNLPNNRIVDNQYKKMVDQKKNYLLGQPFSIQTDNKEYAKKLKKIFNKKFHRLMKSIAEDSLNDGLGWMFIFYNNKGELSFRRFNPFEIIPGWHDAEHTELDYFIRFYNVVVYEGLTETEVTKVEVCDDKGLYYFEIGASGELVPVEPYFQYHFTTIAGDGTETGYSWTKIPLIPFKYNSKEVPLVSRIKSLQDGLNLIESNFQNNMEEDTRNTILVLVNYDGENLAEFRQNLATYGAVKIRTVDGAPGDLRTLQVEVNSENYKVIIEIFKKAIIENAMGYDAKDDRLSGNPNQMNIQSMYSDIDLDANDMETEYQAAFEEVLWFINNHLANTGQGDFDGESVDVIFNRDILISESEVIDNVAKSVGILSDETVVSMHPWVDDPQTEMERIQKQREENIEQYGMAFNPAIPEEESEDE